MNLPPGRNGPRAVEVDGGYATPCWKWLGTVALVGYGEIRVNYRKKGAHRWAYELAHGPIPEGMHIDHLCGNRLCVNPDHLEVVTPAENTRRQWRDRPPDPAAYNRRKTHCPGGHPYDDANTLRRGGRRFCRACARERARRRRAGV